MKLNEVKLVALSLLRKLKVWELTKDVFNGYGYTKGVELYIRKVAPLGDPVEITVRGYELSVRKNDAQCVEVE